MRCPAKRTLDRAALDNMSSDNGAAAYDLVINDDMTWAEYKQFVDDRTPFGERAALIEKYVALPPEAAANGQTLDQVPVRVILRAIRSMFEGFTNPNG